MVERVRANNTGIQNRTFKRYQVLEALTDPVTGLYVLLQLSSTLVIGGLGVFSNIIIKSFGFTVLQTQLLNIAQGGVTIAVMVGGAALATWSGWTISVMHLWTLYLPPYTLSYLFFMFYMVLMMQPPHRRHSSHLQHRPEPRHAHRPAHRLLLHAVHPRPGQSPLLAHLAQRRGADEKVDGARCHFYCVGCGERHCASGAPPSLNTFIGMES